MTNYGTQDGRDAVRAAREGELAAIATGTWPRNLNDSMRWVARGRDNAAWAKKMCEADLEYVDGLEARLAKGEKPWG